MTIENLLLSLTGAINSTGGLLVASEDIPLEAQEGIRITAEDLLLAIPKSQETVFENEWSEVSTDEQLLATLQNDYEVLAFKYVDDADFYVVKPDYEEKE